MNPKRFEQWRILLLAAKVFEVAFGLALAAFSPRILPPYFHFVNQALWQGVLPQDAQTLYNWVFAVLGATISGSALAQAYIIEVPFKAKEPWAWTCLLFSLLIWCIPDTVFSLYYGVWPNAVFNFFPIILVALPLFFTRRAFSKPLASAPSVLSPAIPQLPSGNIDRTQDFFVNKLGFETVTKLPEHNFLILRRGSAEIHFWLAASEAEAKNLGSNSSCYIRVQNILPLFDELKKRAAPFRYELRKQPWGMNEMQIDDPDGNAIRFGEGLDLSRKKQ